MVLAADGAQCLTVAVFESVAKAAQGRAKASKVVAKAAHGQAKAIKIVAMATRRKANAYVEAARAQAKTLRAAAGGGDPVLYGDIERRAMRYEVRTVALGYICRRVMR